MYLTNIFLAFAYLEKFGDRVSYVAVLMVVIIVALSVTVIALGVKVGKQRQIIQTYIDKENKGNIVIKKTYVVMTYINAVLEYSYIFIYSHIIVYSPINTKYVAGSNYNTKPKFAVK